MKPPLYRRLLPLQEKLPRAGRAVWKESLRLFKSDRFDDQRIVFIVGCQRSGTTLLTHIFERDADSRVFGEWSRLSSKDSVEGLRLNPFDEVRTTFARTRCPLVVAKPLVESQNIHALLDSFPTSSALWVFRHYRDVASSSLLEFGSENAVNDLRPISNAESGNWRSEHVSAETQAQVRRFFHEGMNAADAAALFWYARNKLFFDLELAAEPRVMMLRYESFVSDPVVGMKNVYAFIDHRFPGEHVVGKVRSSSVGKGSGVELSNGVLELCEDLYQRLVRVHAGH